MSLRKVEISWGWFAIQKKNEIAYKSFCEWCQILCLSRCIDWVKEKGESGCNSWRQEQLGIRDDSLFNQLELLKKMPKPLCIFLPPLHLSQKINVRFWTNSFCQSNVVIPAGLGFMTSIFTSPSGHSAPWRSVHGDHVRDRKLRACKSIVIWSKNDGFFLRQGCL